MGSQSVTIFLVFLSSLAATSVDSTSRSFLARGSSFSVEDVSSSSSLLTSPDNTFSCGFYTVGVNSNAYWFAIWFTNSKEKTVVWTANRDNPVNGHGSSIALRKDGAFVLSDLDGSIAWQTNTSSINVHQAELLNSGNFVLKDPHGKIVWQSFDFPTDTLLPGQLFTKSKRLVSNVGHQMFSSGYFSFFFDSDNVLRMIYDGPDISSIYWPNVNLGLFQNGRTNYNSSRIAVLDDKGIFTASDQLHFNASDVGLGIQRRLAMDPDGNLRLYSLHDSSGSWVITWQAIGKLCDVHGLCGRNGICVYAPDPTCSCPPQYEPVDLTDWRKGCKRKFERTCNDSEFVELTHVDYYGFDLNFTQPASFEECRQICLQDCRCLAFSYRLTGEGLCFTKSALFNGYSSVDFAGIIYLRVPTRAQTSNQPTLNGSHLDCRSLNAIGAIEVILAVASWWFLFRKRGISASMEDGYHAISSQFRSFSYSELKTTTNKFKEVVGRGGFGAVYKGVLADERTVAVKKLGDVVQGEEEFWAEVSTIARINHMNLARMWGFCSEGKHRLLVYEFVENGSLDKHLFANENFLAWKDRFKVALGTAKGLAYLHHECLEWVIHCDVKPENILLDKDFEPKIADFGLAKLCQRSGHGSSELTRIRGTKGYMAPEWAMNLPLSAKVDVYSYGVMILELVKGIRLSNWVVDEHYSFGEGMTELMRVVRIAKAMIRSGEDSWVDNFVDPRLRGKFNRNQAATMIKAGLSCVEEDRNKRPTMESVVHDLTECEDDITLK
ncbi:hypothetical protein Cgig2_012239 [Carnegiea gigantea]|uniref:Receptor-like serine/threonine-protein kinase n=1 Tax=Carnegiea gigantea TaxID=171969 RepID=A0A9Q1GXI8_9CARY|nr:hypothetical protein Cgig2_012239 [Carnegiea gigantea]